MTFHGMDARILKVCSTFIPSFNKGSDNKDRHLEMAGQAFDSEGHVHGFTDSSVHSAPHRTKSNVTDIDTNVTMNLEIHFFLQSIQKISQF